MNLNIIQNFFQKIEIKKKIGEDINEINFKFPKTKTKTINK